MTRQPPKSSLSDTRFPYTTLVLSSDEVSRSLAACEGSLLLVDASQGGDAQTLANVYLAIDNNHEIIPVLNKVDLPAAEPERVKDQIEEVIGIDASEALPISAKTGVVVAEVLEALVKRLPPPKGEVNASPDEHTTELQSLMSYSSAVFCWIRK